MRRKTRFTDANGSLRSDFRETYERMHLQAARDAGIPLHWLAVEGCDPPAGTVEWEQKGDLTGCWADLLYQLTCGLRGVDYRDKPERKNIPDVRRCLAWMGRLADLSGVDRDAPGLIPYEILGFRVQMYQTMKWDIPE